MYMMRGIFRAQCGKAPATARTISKPPTTRLGVTPPTTTLRSLLGDYALDTSRRACLLFLLPMDIQGRKVVYTDLYPVP